MEIKFGLDKCIVKYHDLKKLISKDMTKEAQNEKAQMVTKHRKIYSISVRSKIFNVLVSMGWVMSQ